MGMHDFLYVIEPEKYTREEVIKLLQEHPEIQYVSLVGVDFAGNDTDEKIPIALFLKDMDDFFDGIAVQTDGSSVVLHGIATLNNAKVDILADPDVNWFVDYNWSNIDSKTGRPVGTLRIPSFLRHDGRLVDSRSILNRALKYVKEEMLELLNSQKSIAGLGHIRGEKVVDVSFSIGTELEFWVMTPKEMADVEGLSASQVMKEQYWQRTKGEVRTAMEQSIEMMRLYGLRPEMGHKEVGGVKAQIDSTGHLTHVMEQLEIDWRFTEGIQAADNELLARQIVKETFHRNGLDVTFKAKPIIGVAGNGEHVHVGITAKLASGKVINLFAPENCETDYMSSVGFGAIMGLLKNYEVINPFVSATNDSFNRLKPGFEAPVCIVTSLGHAPHIASRNRTILAGLLKDIKNPLTYRFEVRSPNPYTNVYFAVAAFYIAMLDGIKATVLSAKTMNELEQELSKDAGEIGFYLETDRAYRSEHDVFDDYSPEERARLFGKHPATVWENMESLKAYPEKVAVLQKGEALSQDIMNAFVLGALTRWKTEILTSLIPQALEVVRGCKKKHENELATDLDFQTWKKIEEMRIYIAKDSIHEKSLLTRLHDALVHQEYALASDLQQEMTKALEKLKDIYEHKYCKNLI